MEKFIRNLDVEHFCKGLWENLPTPERKILQRLLAEDEAKDLKKPEEVRD